VVTPASIASSAEEIACVDVLRAVGRREAVQDKREVPVECDIRCDAAHHGLPSMTVGVDKAGDDDGAGGVDDLAVGRVDGRGDFRDILVLDEHIPTRYIPYIRVHRDDVATAEQRSCRHLCPNLSLVRLLVRSSRAWLVRAASGSSDLFDVGRRARQA